MKHIFIKLLLSITLVCAMSSAYADAANKQGVEGLSTELRTLLQKEMIAVDAAMKDIISANATGDTQKISLIAKQIKDSFILKQNLSSDQKHELHTTLSSDFIKQDQDFHYYAGMLEHAAENNKSELIGFYYSRLFDACSNCHRTHAKYKFQYFGSAITEMKHEH